MSFIYYAFLQNTGQEFKLLPSRHFANFTNTRKCYNESNAQFCNRLTTLFRYCILSRDIGNDFDKLFNLNVADKLRTSLPKATQEYVRLQENRATFSAERIAEIADLHVERNYYDLPVNAKRDFDPENEAFDFETVNDNVAQIKAGSNNNTYLQTNDASKNVSHETKMNEKLFCQICKSNRHNTVQHNQ